MTTRTISKKFDRLHRGWARILAVGVGGGLLMVLSLSAFTIAQTTNTSADSDQSGDLVVETRRGAEPENGDDISLDFLNEGKNPQSVAQLRAMQDHVRIVADRVKEATVNINMGMGQGTGVIVSSDGIILTAAHVIERPRQVALITLSDGSRARARTLGVEAGKDSGMLKIFEVIQSDDASDQETVENNSATDAPQQPAPPKSEQGVPPSDSGSTDSDSADAEDSDEEDSDEEDSGKDSAGESKQGESGPGDPTDNADDSQSDLNNLPLKKESKETAPVDVITEALEKDDLPFFPYLDLGVSAELNDGQWVIAVGHPGGLNEKRGMVVRVGRIINQRSSAIRTDCTLVGGDSGGPLVDMDGNLIAIHSRIGSRLQDNLHVPVDVYSDTWDMLISGYKIGERGRLGLDTPSGSTIVSKVSQRGPADKAGIQVGDIITAIGGKEVSNRSEIGRALSNRYPYETVAITVRRGSNEVKVDVMLGEGSSRGRRRPR